MVPRRYFRAFRVAQVHKTYGAAPDGMLHDIEKPPLRSEDAMETTHVKCRECGRNATRYEGVLPTLGPARVLLVGIAIYLAGMWVLCGFAASAASDPSEAGMMDLLLVVAVLVTIASLAVVWWTFRPKPGAVVVCSQCGARYNVGKMPTYLKGWNYEKIASGIALPTATEGTGDAATAEVAEDSGNAAAAERPAAAKDVAVAVSPDAEEGSAAIS